MFATYKPILRLFIDSARQHRREFWFVLAVTPLATICYQIIPVLCIATIINNLVAASSSPDAGQGVMTVLSPLLAYIGLLFLGDVILWRLVDHWYWKLEGKVVRSMTRAAVIPDARQLCDLRPTSARAVRTFVDAYIKFADSTVYKVLPMLTAMLASVVIFAVSVPYYAVVYTTMCAGYVILAYRITRDTRRTGKINQDAEQQQWEILSQILADRNGQRSPSSTVPDDRLESATDATYRSMLTMKRDHFVQQFFTKSAITAMSGISVTYAGFALSQYSIAPGNAFIIVTLTASTALQLFTFGNDVTRSYAASFNAVRTVLRTPSEHPNQDQT